MATTDFNTIEIELFSAQGALDEFNSGVTRRALVARLNAARPLHPALWVARVAQATAGLLMIASLTWTGLVVSGAPIPHAMVVMSDPAGLPAPLMLLALALCCGAIMVASRELAAVAGERVPLLPNEAKAHQRLVSDVLRLRAARDVRERIGKPEEY